MNQQEIVKKKDFSIASSLIWVVTTLIGLLVVLISKYAVVFFLAAILPSMLAIIFDRNSHRCASATVCAFNLIGVIPFLVQIWNSDDADYITKILLSNIETWMIVYGTAFIGQLMYMVLPLLIVKIFYIRALIYSDFLDKRKVKICEEWGIPITEKSISQDA